MGPVLILDKSALESLNVDEAVWLDAFFSTNIIPSFFAEVLADLEKSDSTGRSGEKIVYDLVQKTPDNFAYPNVDHRILLVGDLLGNAVEMSRRPLIRGGKRYHSTVSGIGVHFDAFPEMEMLNRWNEKKFYSTERRHARTWRDRLSNSDLDSQIDLIRNITPVDVSLSNKSDVKSFVDRFVQAGDVNVLHLAMQLLDVPREMRSVVLKRYDKVSNLSLDAFAPYAMYVFRVELFFYICLSRSFISKDRSSNRVDISYLYYLPFCQAFVSKDKLHTSTAPLFMGDDQCFVSAESLKQGLTECDVHYSSFIDEIEKVGVQKYASRPPSTLKNSVVDLWDSFMKHDWRDFEMTPRPDKALGIVRQHKEAQPASEQDAPDDAEYWAISRRVKARKGKWRILPAGVEEGKKVRN